MLSGPWLSQETSTNSAEGQFSQKLTITKLFYPTHQTTSACGQFFLQFSIIVYPVNRALAKTKLWATKTMGLINLPAEYIVCARVLVVVLKICIASVKLRGGDH